MDSTNNTDPEGECGSPSDPTSCGLDGLCDGIGACGYWPGTTECVAQTCVGSTKFFADYCDGGGNCLDSLFTSCAPYVCDGVDDCRTDVSNIDSKMGSSTCFVASSTILSSKLLMPSGRPFSLPGFGT